MSSRFTRYGNYGNYNTTYRRYANAGNRNWARSTGTAKPVDARKFGQYPNKDELVLSQSVSIVSWLGSRIICFFHAGVFYFGRKAIKLLENQAQFILPQLEQVANNYYAQPSERYSFGIVPHVGDSEKMVAVGQKDAYWLLFNFLATNVLPVTFDPGDGVRHLDMFETPENSDTFDNIFRDVFDNVTHNPFDPANTEAVVGMIGQLFDEGLLQVQQWGKEYRKNYRSWTDPLEAGRQPQPPAGAFTPQATQNH